MKPETYQLLVRYWSDFLGVQIEGAESAGGASSCEESDVDIVWHKGLEGFSGLFLFRFGGRTIVSAPPERLRFAALRLGGGRELRAFEAEAVQGALGAAVSEIKGPVILFYCDTAPERVAGPEAQELEGEEREMGLALLREADEGEAEASELGAQTDRLFGVFAEGRLVSVAGYDLWGGQLANLGVLTAREFRNNGFGQAALAAAVRDGVGRGYVMQYRPAAGDGAAVRLARRLGFDEFARAITVELVKATR